MSEANAPIPAVQSGAVALVGRYITLSKADDESGNAVISPDEPADGCYWTLIGSGWNADQNEQAIQIVAAINRGLAAPQSEPLPGVREPFTVDDLAQEIRRVDGEHTLGAGALAEALSPFIIERIYQGLVAVSGPPLPGGVGEAVAAAIDALREPGNKTPALLYNGGLRDAKEATLAILAALSGKEQG